MMFGILLLMAFAVVPAGAQESYPVLVKKDAFGAKTTTWEWEIAKSGDQSQLTLSPGQTFDVNYDVTVTALAVTSWTVEGRITLRNLSETTVTVQSIEDVLNDSASTPATVFDCVYYAGLGAGTNITLPQDLPPTDDANNGVPKIVCQYTAAGTSTPPTENTATAFDADGNIIGVGSYGVVYSGPTEVVDECIDVTDSMYGSLGVVCAADAPKTFEYTLAVGPYETCGEYSLENIASFATRPDGTTAAATGSARWTVNVNVPCATGCTLTQGYWKTHSEFGPAPYDATWAQLPNGASTPFYYSGKTWYQVFWTPPAGGNAYDQLAHQYMAARLNILNGAATTAAVDAALAGAHTYFNNPANTGSPAPSGATRTQLGAWASTLDSYNNGLIGPGHCSE
jgi:hypothetical protein